MKEHTEHYKKDINKIVKIVSARYNIPEEEIYGNRRDNRRSIARQIVWKIAREIYGGAVSYETLGRYFSGRTHPTILFGIRSVEGLMYSDKDTARAYKELLRQSRAKLQPTTIVRDEELYNGLKSVLECREIVNARIEIRKLMKDLVLWTAK